MVEGINKVIRTYVKGRWFKCYGKEIKYEYRVISFDLKRPVINGDIVSTIGLFSMNIEVRNMVRIDGGEFNPKVNIHANNSWVRHSSTRHFTNILKVFDYPQCVIWINKIKHKKT